MDNTMFLAAIFGPMYIVFGLSLVLYAPMWVKVVKDMEKNHYIMLPMMMFSLILGLALVQMHNIWEWNLWVVITITAWGALIKGVFYLLAPGSVIKATLKTFNCTCWYYPAGIVMLVLGAAMSYYVYLA